MLRVNFQERYEQHLVASMFRPCAEGILAELKLMSGDSLLDVACGTGIVARCARETLGPGARITGVDRNPKMLDVARSVSSDIDWREGDAAALPLRGGEEFSVVVCQQGLQFFPDKPAAMIEMKRALARDGRMAIATWCPIEEMPLLRDLHRVAENHLGLIVDSRHSFGETEPLEALLREAGMRDISVRVVTRVVRFSDPEIFLDFNTGVLVGMVPGSREMTDIRRDELIDAISHDSVNVMAPYIDSEGLAFDMNTTVATALN